MYNQNGQNYIRQCLEKCIHSGSFAKFQQVLEYVGEKVYVPLYRGYNDNLLIELQKIKSYDSNLPPGFKLENLVSLKIRFYSFRFIGDVGKVLLMRMESGDEKAEDNYLTLSKIVLWHGLTAKNDSANLALVELEQLCVNRNITLQSLYINHKPKFLRLILKAILQKLNNSEYSTNGENSNDNGSCDGFGRPSWPSKGNRVITYMTRALEVFKIGTITSEDVTQSLIIVTNFIHKEEFDRSIEIFFSDLATHQNIDLCTFISGHIQAIVTSLLVKRKLSYFDMVSSVDKLCSFCDKTPRDLLATKFTSIKGRLILEYANDPKKVSEGFFFLSKYEQEASEQPHEDEFSNEQILISRLNPSIIGILLGVDYHFTTTKKDLGSSESIGHLKGLCKIISLLNSKQVGVIYVKLLSTLCLILRLRPVRNNRDLNVAIVDLWRMFVSKLDQELRKSLLINICVALYDLVEDCPDLVSCLYVNLLDKLDARTMSGKLRSLFFIPNIPEMSQVYSYLSSYVIRDNSVGSLQELQKAIDCALPLLKLENQKCRLIALTKIKQLLLKNQEIIVSNMLISPDEPIPPVISKTIEALLALASIQDTECCVEIAESLGIIGAINPIRLDHLIYGDLTAKKSTSVTSLTSPEFMASLIERLKHSLFSDQRSESESANYALQVLVKNFSVFKECDGMLSTEALKALELCKNTSYKGNRKVQPDFSVSVYEKFKAENHYSYADWLDKFTLNIISVIKDQKIQELLFACSYIFKYNLKLGEYLLPHTVVYIILNQPAQVDLIKREIAAIVDEDVGVSTQDLDNLYTEDVRGNIRTLHFQCANMIFPILDVVSKLDSDSKGVKSPVCLSQRQRVTIREFLLTIPKDRLATLASKCRSHARALYYFEQFFNQHRDQFDKFASALQTTFVNLDDTYEAAGVETARKSSTTLLDDIANHQAFGRYDRAFVCCNTGLETLESETGREALIEDALKCLSNQGDYHRLYEKSKQLMVQYSSCKRNILQYAIEATWKLGKWDELNQTLDSEQVDSLLESASVSQGYLLASINEERHKMGERLKLVRHNLMKPLSIAMMDRSAYFRGYQNLLVLHGVEDFNLYLETVEQNLPDLEKLDENTIDSARKELCSKFELLFSVWNRRNKLIQPSLRSLEPLLAWQRSISQRSIDKYPFLKEMISVDIGQRWLTSADSAREARSFDRAFFCLTQAQRWFGFELDKISLNLRVEYHTEQAKLAWDQGEQTKAIRNLNLSLERLKNHRLNAHLEARWDKNRNVNKTTGDIFPDLNDIEHCDECAKIPSLERESFAKLKMLLIHYCEEAAAALPDRLFFMYEECVHLGMTQEETYFRLARYYDRLRNYYMENPMLCNEPTEDKSLNDTQMFSQNLMGGDKEEVYSKLMEHSIVAFGQSLKYGVRYVRESMPRLLNIWYDLGSKKVKPAMPFGSRQSSGGNLRSTSSRIESTTRFIEELRTKLPPYYFMTAISLLLSRVTHSHSGISKKTCDILEFLCTNYPSQITWQMIAIIHDKENEERRKAGTRILSNCKKKNAHLNKIITDTWEFALVIRELSLKLSPLDKDSKAPKRKLGPFVKLSEVSSKAATYDFSKAKVMVPNQSSIRAIIPIENSQSSLKDHVPFPEQNVSYIEGLGPEVRIFNSLQKPKQVTLRCDNGKTVNLLCKAGDDMRKDNRCVEFLNLLNRILKRNNQSNERFFEIQTFLVLPLTNTIGIIEMVPNCESLKNLMEPLYQERNPSFAWLPPQKAVPKPVGPAEQHNIYMNTLLPKTKPSVFPTWFLRKFTEPTAWYMARLAYTRTTGVISMGGYIIGLGDRHLDNILIDTCNGRIVHVDFNLLFHQGETLPCPELVPFRLTHNIVDTFGSLGTEGNFRRVCEIAMGVMRKEKDALLTTLIPFIHDPCSEWIKHTHRGNRIEPEDKNGENRAAKHKIEVVEKKLKGFPRSKKLKPLTLIDSYSVEAQVDTLIQEAMDTHNLSQMYHGWCPHI